MRHDERYWYTVSTKNDFLCKTNGMRPIQNIPGINNEEISWFVHPETGNIVHLVKVLRDTRRALADALADFSPAIHAFFTASYSSGLLKAFLPNFTPRAFAAAIPSACR